MQINLLIDTSRPSDIAEALVLLSTLEAAAGDDVPTGTTAEDAEFLAGLKADAVAAATPPVMVSTGTWTAPTPDPAVVFAKNDTDVDGVKWDPALHASTKAKTIDGRWKARKRRGSADAEAPAAAVVAAPPPPPVDLPVPPPPPAEPAMVPAGPPAVLTFREVMAKVTARKLGKAKVDELLAIVGLAPDMLAPLVKPENAHMLATFNALVDECPSV
jgi:hypothetical protein